MSAAEMRKLAAKHRDFHAEADRQYRYILWRIKLAAKFGCFQIRYSGEVDGDVKRKLSRNGFYVCNYDTVEYHTLISW